MSEIILKPQILTKYNFSEFGDVVETDNNDYITINDGFAKKYKDLANVDTTDNNGITTIHIFVAKKRPLPLQINMLEKHPHFSQAFIPSTNQKFLLVVAPNKNNIPDISKINAFISNGKQGVNYAKGVWHFPLISLVENMKFFVIDRKDVNDHTTQCLTYDIKETIFLKYNSV